MPHRPGAALAAAALLLPAALGAQTITPQLARRVDAWYRQTQRATRGRWGIAIADERGNILWSRQPDAPVIPASTVKIFTTGYARTQLGGDARRATRVLGTGFLDSTSGAWLGTWGLELNGDPSLEDPHHLGPRLYDLAAQLALSGVRRLEGPLLVTSEAGPATATYPVGWPARDRGTIFAPLVGALTVHENTVSIWVAPSGRAGHRPRITGDSPTGIAALIVNEATTRAGRRSKLSLAPHRGGWVLHGWIGSRAGAREVKAVAYDPERVLEVVWAQALRQAGITWAADANSVLPPNDGRIQTLAEVYSPPLDSLAADIDRRSLNLGAELLLRWAAGLDAPAESLAAHVASVVGSNDGLRLVDGSGLSDLDRVTPRMQVTYLARMPTLPRTRIFPLLLPANGTGTLTRMAGRLPGAGVLRAKTGTLANVAALSGYLGRPDGVFVISLIYNGWRTSAARRAQLSLLRLLGARGAVTPDDFGLPADSTDDAEPTDHGAALMAH
jgi:D-alanyl-D-alanine carboxypeptidase/D-alanyl-D-alanine-endopeptidase (penicillin-binding protein 4)